MSGMYRVDQIGHAPKWFHTETEALAEADHRTPTYTAPLVIWFDSWPYEVAPETPGEAGRRTVREQLGALVPWLRLEVS